MPMTTATEADLLHGGSQKRENSSHAKAVETFLSQMRECVRVFCSSACDGGMEFQQLILRQL